jgi:predicted transcriptional regulator
MENEILSSVLNLTSIWIANGHSKSPQEVCSFISEIYQKINSIDDGKTQESPSQNLTLKQIRDTVNDEYVVCLEDNRRFKSMKRHLRTSYNLSPEEYREKWGLPKNHPIVCKSYSDKRSKLAKDIGFGKN